MLSQQTHGALCMRILCVLQCWQVCSNCILCKRCAVNLSNRRKSNLVCLQGKSFIKDALKCMAHGLRHKFSCISRKCLAIKDMVFQLQRECYTKHNLCAAAKDNVNVIVEMIHFQDLLPKGWVLTYSYRPVFHPGPCKSLPLHGVLLSEPAKHTNQATFY